MKNYISLPILAILLNSCIVSTKITTTNDQYLGVDRIKLEFTPITLQEEAPGTVFVKQMYDLSSTFLYEGTKNERPLLTATFQLVTPIRAEELDSVMFLVLDNENIRISSTAYTYKEYASSSASVSLSSSVENKQSGKTFPNNETRTIIKGGTHQLMSRTFAIPDNLWISIANSESVGYRFYLGKDGFDAKLHQADLKKLKYFFELAICKRDANLPPTPEGLKKL